MAKFNKRNGETSVILRVKMLDSASAVGAGKTGLAYNTSGLLISTIADNESSATVYSVAGSTIEDITTLGTYAAPTATKCRVKKVDDTNHAGIIELQLANARYAVSGAKSLLISIQCTGCVQQDIEVQLDAIPVDIRAIVGDTTAPTNLMKAFNGDGYPDGLAQGGGLSYIDLAAGEPSTDNMVTPCLVTITNGLGEGQTRYAPTFTGASRRLHVYPDFLVAPDATSEYVKTPCPDFLRSIIVDVTEGKTAQEVLSILLATCAGQWTAPGTFKTPSGGATRVAATVSDTAPYRSGITLSPSA